MPIPDLMSIVISTLNGDHLARWWWQMLFEGSHK
jgi:hypothetical protein